MWYDELDKKPQPIHYIAFGVILTILMFVLYRTLLKLITLLG